MPIFDLKRIVCLASSYPQTAIYTVTDKIFFKNKLTPYPRLINCFVTEKCNFNCPMCHVKQSRDKKMTQLKFSDFQKLIEQSRSYHPAFHLSGGEPLLHPEIDKIISVITKNQMVKGLVTNGLLLEEKAGSLIKSGLDFLAISLDGSDEATQYKRGYVKNSFEKIIKGIEKIIRLRKKRSLPHIRVATVINDYNIDNFDRIYKVVNELKIDQWTISHHFFYNNEVVKRQRKFSQKYQMGDDIWGEYIGDKKSLYDKKQIETIKEKLILIDKLTKKSRVKINHWSDFSLEKYYSGVFPSSKSTCNSPNYQLIVRGDGDMELCQGYIIGNIKRDLVNEAWRSKKANHFREIKEKVKITPACFRCCSLNFKFNED